MSDEQTINVPPAVAQLLGRPKTKGEKATTALVRSVAAILDSSAEVIQAQTKEKAQTHDQLQAMYAQLGEMGQKYVSVLGELGAYQQAFGELLTQDRGVETEQIRAQLEQARIEGQVKIAQAIGGGFYKLGEAYIAKQSAAGTQSGTSAERTHADALFVAIRDLVRRARENGAGANGVLEQLAQIAPTELAALHAAMQAYENFKASGDAQG